ncbi:MAG: ATP-grasp fold amidoligase family protein [Kiloniellales bacterium]|nr:ATP-grasp fold amidoligase family protein [Kiloniellales bacterium]
MPGLNRARLRRVPRILRSPRLQAFVLRALASDLLALALPPRKRGALRYRWRYGNDRRLVEINHLLRTGAPVNLEAPRTYCDKMSHLKLFHDNPLMAFCTDKVSVRRYVAWKGLAETLVPLLAAYERAADFRADDLPARFVAKASHGSGWVLFCRDRQSFDVAAARRRFARWLAEDYSLRRGETNYRGIPPRIVVEPLIEHLESFIEYKFFCFHGAPKFVSVISSRIRGEPVRGIYEMDWRKADYGSEGLKLDPATLPAPPEFARLKAMAEKLAEDFLHVRVDFIVADGDIYFSELTFYNLGGFVPLVPEAMNEVVGGYMDLARAPVYAARGRDVLKALAAAGAGPTG